MKRFLARAALAASGAVIALLAGELLVRAFGPEIQVVFRDSIVASPDPALGYELRPGGADFADRISSDGLRDGEVPRAKPASVVRIAAIGDSITYAFGIPREQGWTERLEALLNEAAAPGGPRFEVLNLGVPGYNVLQIAERLRALGLAFEPDAIVYGYSLNDPQDISIEADALRTLGQAFERDANAGWGRWLSRSRLYLLARKIGFERVKQEVLRSKPPTDPGFEAAKAGGRERYFRTLHGDGESAARLQRGLDEIAAAARERGLPVLVAVFPLFGAEDGAGPEALADVHRRVSDAAAQRGFAVLDLLPVYGAAAPGAKLSIDFMHPSPLGHRIAAAAMLEWICRHGWGPAAALDCARAPALLAADPALAPVLRAQAAR